MPADAAAAFPAPSRLSPCRTTPVTGRSRTAPTAARLIRTRTYEEASPPGLGALLDGLDGEVAAAGRVHLAKDARPRPEPTAAMNPRLPELRSLRRELGPRGVFVSDLARRLGL